MTDAEILTICLILVGILTTPFWGVWASRLYDWIMGYRPKDDDND